MKKHLRFFSAILIFFILFTFYTKALVYSASTDDGYMEGYYKGWRIGIEKAEDDMARGRSKNYLRAMPSETEIIKEYSLEDETIKYRNAFLDGYKNGFKEGYNWIYSVPNDKDDDERDIVTYADSIGYAMGEAYGKRDYYDGKSNRWSRAVPSNLKIADIFDLKKETSEYRIAFLDAFIDNFKEGYEEGYRKAKFEPFEVSLEQGAKDGEHFGGLLGEIYGKKDFFNGKVSNPEQALPSRTRIISEFSLNNDSDEYLEAFVSSFNFAFIEKYYSSYRSSNSKINDITYENGYKHGVEIGLNKGEGLAQMDLFLMMPNNILRHKPYEQEIINEYRLYLETEKYREGFISGFNEGLTEGYIKTYQESNYSKSLRNTETQIIPISGGKISTPDNRIFIKVSKGTYYNDVVLTIDGLSSWYLPLLDKLIKASDIYSVSISNPSYQFDNSKEIELSFEYYGPQSGGIYKLVNNNWIYLPSKISENRITTYIKPNSINISSGTYAVFIDNRFQTIKDIRGHWAKDEINTYVRRGLVGLYADNNFGPNTPISRIQLLEFLNTVYKWNYYGLEEKIKELEKLEDYDELVNYKNLVAYALKHGYLDIRPDNRFSLYGAVTYNEIDNIIKKLKGNNTFNWNNIAYQMVQEKDTRSKSFDSMNNSITRAEVIYMLYLLNDK